MVWPPVVVQQTRVLTRTFIGQLRAPSVLDMVAGRAAYTNLKDAAMSSGLRDYVGGKYADLMQKFWVALKGSGVVLGSNLDTWVQSLDQGPLLGRRFHTCAPGQVPQFFNKNKDSIPPSEAITWRNGRPYINEGVVDMSMGGCTPGIGVDIGAGPVPVYGASVADSLSFHVVVRDCRLMRVRCC